MRTESQCWLTLLELKKNFLNIQDDLSKIFWNISYYNNILLNNTRKHVCKWDKNELFVNIMYHYVSTLYTNLYNYFM